MDVCEELDFLFGSQPLKVLAGYESETRNSVHNMYKILSCKTLPIVRLATFNTHMEIFFILGCNLVCNMYCICH